MSQGTVGPPGKKRGRQAVMSDSGSDEEGSPGTSSVRVKTAARKRGIPRGEFVNAKLRGMSLCFTVVSGPRVCVPIDGPWVDDMIQDMWSRRGE